MQLLARARIDFSMDWPELARCTPRYFEALVKRIRLNIERADRSRDFMLAQIAAEVANCYGYPRYKEWRKPTDFLPRWQLSEDRKMSDGRSRRKPRMTKAKKMALAAQFRETFMRFVAK
jgi:hypothetical protein